jgi:hypothetical protein
MNPSQIRNVGSVLFGCALIHTFPTQSFEYLAQPAGRMQASAAEAKRVFPETAPGYPAVAPERMRGNSLFRKFDSRTGAQRLM